MLVALSVVNVTVELIDITIKRRLGNDCPSFVYHIPSTIYRTVRD